MINVLDMLVENDVKANPVQAGDYVGDDGLLYCGKCHTLKQSRIELPEFLKKSGCKDIVPVECECQKAEDEYLNELKKREEADIRRCKCFADDEMAEWRFENDDGKGDTHAMNVARNYVKNFEMLHADNVGLFIHGDVGVGKSFVMLYAKCKSTARKM